MKILVICHNHVIKRLVVKSVRKGDPKKMNCPKVDVEATRTVRNQTDRDYYESVLIPAKTEVEIFLKVKLIEE